VNSPFDGFVAVVDDDPSVRRALTRLLRSVGVPCLTHDSGSEFLASPKLHDFDCLILDVHMPRMSGIEVLEEIRVVASKLPVVLMTARYDVDFAEKALVAGASAFLRKPFTEEELFAAISDATGMVLEP
jgi:FixJ family two-component response regulator